MGSYRDGIADNLSREFRAMSSERDRRWRSPSRSGGGDYDDGRVSRRASYDTRPGGGHVSPLRYGHYSGSRRTSVTSGRYTDSYTPRWGRSSASERVRSAPIVDMSASAPALRGRWRREADRGGDAPSARSQRRHQRNGRRAGTPSESSTCSSSYSYSGSASSSSGSSSGFGGRAGKGKGYVRPRSQQQQQQQRQRPRPPSQLGGWRSGAPPPPDAPPPGAIRWVDSGRQSTTTYGEAGGPGQPEQQGRVTGAATSEFLSQRPLLSAQMAELQPSGLLWRVIEAVAHYRGVAPPGSVPSEVILAFDEYVSRGSTMLKFVARGPPHSRYFAIRFLDVVAGSMRIAGRGEHGRAPNMPYAVLSWFHTASSRHMIRFLPLHDLIEVKADGTDHRHVRRRTVQPGVLRGPRSGFVTSYVRADFILQFRFSSRLSRAEETLALMASNRTQYLAWLVVGSFISQIGGFS
ncbi:hypothetical protein NESM_000622200 [Novymonas esmeraldas]|uniref:PH-like domain-containing protein n=1 Tax=Novymonas esmeraldas TaxID=1808958 RepID=A0AAW0ESV3_9TRYP